jgi:hypothetical protein
LTLQWLPNGAPSHETPLPKLPARNRNKPRVPPGINQKRRQVGSQPDQRREVQGKGEENSATNDDKGMKMKTRDMSQSQFDAACARRGFKRQGFFGYYDLNIPEQRVSVSILNAGTKRRAQLAYLIRQQDKHISPQQVNNS